ncbi:unnamed protein product [Notodromas monacha]|uniref:Uncharacterized protein n=1 Tax=Notodromas monacha TaxID=399045 RepID=A0A7R9BDL5_9CRUS|nr:unnamed protein product [Notodromas monacha]CAG0913434.1 unnamed protein product [Notodromas monacha]
MLSSWAEDNIYDLESSENPILWTELSTSIVISDGFTSDTPHSMPELGESSFIPNGTSCEFLQMNHRPDVISQFDPRHAVMSLGLDTSVALPLEFNPRLGSDGLSALVNAATSSSGLVVADCLRGSTENLYLPVTDFADCDMTDDKSSHRVGFDVQ